MRVSHKRSLGGLLANQEYHAPPRGNIPPHRSSLPRNVPSG